MDLLALAFFPLVNVGTQAVKRLLFPHVATWLWPMFNVALAIGIAVAANALSVTSSPDVQKTIADLLGEGIMMGGAATISYETLTRFRSNVRHVP